MAPHLVNGLAHRVGLIGHDEQGLLLVLVVQRLDDLGKGVLEDDGVQSPVPAEEQPRDDQDSDVDGQQDIPGIHPFLTERKMEIKSVPPAVASTQRQSTLAKPPITPPKMLISSTS